MILPKREMERFETDGYAIAESFYSEREVLAMRAELERFKRDGMLHNVATEGDGESHTIDDRNLQICPITPRSPFYRALPFHPRLKEVVGGLIGTPFVFYLDQIFLKPPGRGVGTGWHQDNAYFKVIDPTRGVGAWTAIHEATVANGTLHIVPGSHREGLGHERDPNSDHHIRCEVDESRAVPVELPAGGTVFFNFGIAHCTKANTSACDRAGLALHFLHTEHVPSEGNRLLMTHICGPEATGGRSEYGVVVDATWDQEVDRVLLESTDG